jgi:hypothetical protein
MKYWIFVLAFLGVVAGCSTSPAHTCGMNQSFSVTQSAGSPTPGSCALPTSDTFVIGTSYVDDTTTLEAASLGGLCSGTVDTGTCDLSLLDCETSGPGALLQIDFHLTVSATTLKGTAIVTDSQSGCSVTYEETGVAKNP